jgi:thiol-disulfide isomerase/thioredoxin
MLKGVIKGDKVDEVGFTYSPYGDPMDNASDNIDLPANGTFTYNPALPSGEADVTVLIGDTHIFGVHLVKGKTVEMTLTKSGADYTVAFRGDDDGISRFVNKDIRAFDMMKYFSPDPAEGKPNAEYRRLLDSEYKSTVAMLGVIKKKDVRAYYAKLVDAQYRWMKIRLIMDKAEDNKTDYKKDAEYRSLVKDIDINDDINFRTALSLTAVIDKVKTEMKMKGDNEAYCEDMMKVVDTNVTNPKLRRLMVRLLGMDYFSYGNPTGDTKAFLKKLENFAGKDSDLVVPYRQMLVSKEKTRAGKVMPDITLNTVDGKTVQLSSLIRGKFTYIDVWATWCGPCCREIPYLEKLVERFKGNDKVQFISISTDQSVDAWKAKIGKDKPQWAQYILTVENNKKFSTDWGITGIPRFIMVKGDGTIFSSNASRPSEEDTATTITEQTK